MPRYHEILNWSCDRVGLHARDFDLYRLRIDYPLVSTTISTGFNVLAD